MEHIGSRGQWPCSLMSVLLDSFEEKSHFGTTWKLTLLINEIICSGKLFLASKVVLYSII